MFLRNKFMYDPIFVNNCTNKINVHSVDILGIQKLYLILTTTICLHLYDKNDS